MKQTTKKLDGQMELPIVVPCTISTVQDPYWDEITTEPSTDDSWDPADFGECPRKVASDGQMEIFFDDSAEPPDPDDYQSVAEYELAWQHWLGVGEQSHKTSVPQHDATEYLPTCVGEQSHKTPVPQHKFTHFVERYWVERASKKHFYWRYMWVEGEGKSRKIRRRYLGRGGHKVELVRNAIAQGKSPCEIKKLIDSL